MSDEEPCGNSAVDVDAITAEMEERRDALKIQKMEAEKIIQDLIDTKEKLEVAKAKTSDFRFIKQKELVKEIENIDDELQQRKEDTEHIRGAFLTHTLETSDEYKHLKKTIDEALEEEIDELEQLVKNIPFFNWCYKKYVEGKIKRVREDLRNKAKVKQWLEDRQDMVDMGKVLGNDAGAVGNKRSDIEKMVCYYCDPKQARALNPEFSLF